MYISALSSENADREFSHHVAVSEGKNETTANGYTGTAAVSQEIEPKTDIMSLQVAAGQKYDETKKRDDNSNICAHKETLRRDYKDEKFPRLVDSCYHFAVILLQF